jgi:hypothetical protein
VLLKLALPHIERDVDKVTVVRWFKSEGDEVEYGDDIVDLEVQSIRRLMRDHDANRILGRRRSRAKPGKVEFWNMDVSISVRVTSADFGTMLETYAAAGDVLEQGDLMAVLSTESQDASGDFGANDVAALPEFRTTTSFLESP